MEKDREKELRERAKDAYLMDKNYPLAIKLYDKLLTEYPNRWNYADKAEVYKSMKQYDKAIIQYYNAINSISDKGEWGNREKGYYYGKIAELYYKLGNYDIALKYVGVDVEITPEGYVHIDYDWEEGYTGLDLAAEHNKKYAYTDRAKLLYKMQKYEMALDDINEVLNDEITTEVDKILKAKIIIKLEKYDQLPDLIKDLEEVEKDYCLALSYKNQNLYDKALKYLSKVLKNEIHSTWIDRDKVLLIQAEIYKTLNDSQKELDVLTEYSEYCGEYDKLGDYYLKQNNYQKAIENYNKQLEEDAYDSDTYFNRCKAKNQIKDLKGAIEDLIKAIQIAPYREEYADYLKEINILHV